MSERNGNQPGVPCWVASVHPDPERAVGFYAELFGWQAGRTTWTRPGCCCSWGVSGGHRGAGAG